MFIQVINMFIQVINLFIQVINMFISGNEADRELPFPPRAASLAIGALL